MPGLPAWFLTPLGRLTGALLLIAGLLAGLAWWLDRDCAQRLELELRRATDAAQARERKLFLQLEEERAKRKVVYVEKLRIIEIAADPSGCADTRVPDAISSELRPSP